MNEYFEFWEKTKEELQKIPLDIHRRVIDYPLENVQVEQVDFLSFLGERIFGYLLLPKTAGKQPIVIDCLGYMNHIQEPWQFAHWTQIGCACFVIDNRGQGGLTKDRVPYQTIWHEAPMGRGFLDKADWYQRRLFADHLRSVEVVRTFTEINQDQIILRGGSQGGGVVLMVNSLVDFPILATFADVPSHSCLENRVAEGTGSYQIIHQYLQEHPQAHEKIAAVLPYFDSRHFVSQIKNPVFASVGSHDPICPMKDFFPSYHQIKARKAVRVYWKKGHGGGETTQIRREMRQIQQLLQEVKNENSYV